MADLLMGSSSWPESMALGLVIYKGRFKQTMRNIGRMLASLLTFHNAGNRGFAGLIRNR